MIRLTLTALALSGALLGAREAQAFGNDRADPGYHGQIQQGVYDFHRQNAERQPVVAVAPRESRTARRRR